MPFGKRIIIRLLVTIVIVCGTSVECRAQSADSVVVMAEDSVINAESLFTTKQKRDWATWKPNSKKALWLALVIPGGGQIYNHKYWKLPIFYGGLVGCLYALSWNGQMYKDYAQAYSDIIDDDPNTMSYNQFLHLGVKIDDSNKAKYTEIFKNRKDKYRRWRDLSFFCMIGVYAISVIDAYIDAEMSDFDISRDLSMKIRPKVMNNNNNLSQNPLTSSSVGVACSLNF